MKRADNASPASSFGSRSAAEDIGKSATPEAVTDFQKSILPRAKAAADWLVRSINACDGAGSAAYYSRWYKPFRGWAYAYPETTGYIVPTLLSYAAFSGQPSYADVAIRQADWIASLELPGGALPGGVVVGEKKAGPSIFNTGQMVLGLVAAYDHTGDAKYLDSATRAASWLATEVDESAGIWTKHAYIPGYSPAYYTRVAWPMLEVCHRREDATIQSQARRVLDTVIGWQQERGEIRNWSFRPGQYAFTHTIAYTIRGLLESARLLGDAGKEYEAAACRAAELFRRRTELRGKLAGAYDEDVKGSYWFTCLTGNCQMALVWMKINRLLGDARFLSTALKVLQYVIPRQNMNIGNANKRGAIAGSRPIWGRYLTLRYPNWATKFYLDALMLAHREISTTLEAGPCGSQ